MTIEIRDIEGKWIKKVDSYTLVDADLNEADLNEADLSGADLRRAYLRGADLRGADLKGADLSGADLKSADLRRADLRGADLNDADLRGADLRGADLTGSNLKGAAGNSKEIKSIFVHDYSIVYTKDVLAISCQQKTFDEWERLTQDELFEFDEQAESFYRDIWLLVKPLVYSTRGVGG